jgi:formiminotetrahydrofolate cyclodeaminase
MKLNIFIDDQVREVSVSDEMAVEAQAIFERMDADMDKGWQMGRSWIDELSIEQRCQVAADKLLTAIEQDNQAMAQMMTAYILYKMPKATDVKIDTEGEMLETEFIAY